MTNYIDDNKIIISDYLSDFFTDIHNPEILDITVNNIKEVIKKYAKIKIINENQEVSQYYKNKDIQLYFDNFCKNVINSKKLISKDDLFLKFKNSILSNVKKQDSNYIFNEVVIKDDQEIKFTDIKEKLHNIIYTDDINKFVDMYLCNNECKCTQEMLCNLKIDIIEILNLTLSYKPTNIIMLDSELMENTIVDDIEIYNKIYNFLTSRNFDVYNLEKTFPQIYLPS